MLVASTRMYNVAPAATAAWHRLLGHVFQLAGLSLRIDDHPHPASLASLWGRPDLGCAFMCGWPLAQEAGSRPVIAAPIPLGSAGPRYHSVFVVKATDRFQTLEQTFGHRFAFNARSSHSGWNMPQAYLARIGGTFAAELGPFGPHQNAAAAVLAGEADVAAIDSLVWALLCRHANDLAAGLRVVGQTPDQPSPPFVGSAALRPGDAKILRAAFLGLSKDAAGQVLLADVCLAGFAPASLADYDETLAIHPAAVAPMLLELRPPPNGEAV
jgi:ABC-type phosphate/phosphonate transport system substrate-binding protein